MKDKLLFLIYCSPLLCVIGLGLYIAIPDDTKHEEIVAKPKIELVYTHHAKSTFIDEMESLDEYGSIEPCDSIAYAFIVDNEIQHPEIVLAQMKIESGNYQSGIAKKNNNYFGMRHPAQRLTVSLGQKNGYARYRNWAYSVIDYGLWQRRYAYDLTEEEYLTKLSNTYAEDPNYVSKVKNIAKNLENKK
jgi:hypothetical protein